MPAGASFPNVRGDVLFNPLRAATACKLWLRADMGITIGTGVSTWADQSGSGLGNFTQATGANQPALTTNAINGKPGLTFTAASSQVVTGPVYSLTAAHIFIVAKVVNAAVDNAIWNFGSGSAGHWPFTDGHIYENFASTARPDTGLSGVTLTNAQVYEVISTSTELTNFFNGTQLFTTATNTVGWFASGNTLGTNAAGVFLDGVIAEVVMFGAKLAANEQTNMRRYLKARYNTP